MLKTLINRGQADQVLILTPAVARWQWQAELRHKFNIEVPVLDRRGAQLQLVSSDGTTTPSGSTPWRESRRLTLSYDWLRRNAERFFRDETQYDMVVFDEAHHARYLDVATPQNRRPNSYLTMLRRLSERTGGLMLLTATPMQIDLRSCGLCCRFLTPAGNGTRPNFGASTIPTPRRHWRNGTLTGKSTHGRDYRGQSSRFPSWPVCRCIEFENTLTTSRCCQAALSC